MLLIIQDKSVHFVIHIMLHVNFKIYSWWKILGTYAVSWQTHSKKMNINCPLSTGVTTPASVTGCCPRTSEMVSVVFGCWMLGPLGSQAIGSIVQTPGRKCRASLGKRWLNGPPPALCHGQSFNRTMHFYHAINQTLKQCMTKRGTLQAVYHKKRTSIYVFQSLCGPLRYSCVLISVSTFPLDGFGVYCTSCLLMIGRLWQALWWLDALDSYWEWNVLIFGFRRNAGT